MGKGGLTKQELLQTRAAVDTRIASRSVARELLLELARFGGAMALKSYRPSASIAQIMSQEERWEYLDMLRQERRELERLKARKLLEEKMIGDELHLCLSNLGDAYTLKQSIIYCQDMYPDGTYCVVLYDVPQTERVQRDAFRRFLKEAQFVQLQKSMGWLLLVMLPSVLCRSTKASTLVWTAAI